MDEQELFDRVDKAERHAREMFLRHPLLSSVTISLGAMMGFMFDVSLTFERKSNEKADLPVR